MPVGWKAQSEYADNVRKVASAATLKSNVTLDELLDFLGMFADANKKQNVIIAALIDRVKALEENPMAYRGTWTADKLYPPNTFITHAGSCWHTDVESRGVRPGDANTIWVLAVKKGKDHK
jgi:hypothetical protein